MSLCHNPAEENANVTYHRKFIRSQSIHCLQGYLRKTDDKGGIAEKTGQMIPESSYSMAAKYMHLFLSQINDCTPKNIPMNWQNG